MSVLSSVIPVRPDPFRVQRGHEFWPAKWQAEQIPDLYETDGTGLLADRVAHLHYFLGSSSWWIVELQANKGMAFGYSGPSVMTRPLGGGGLTLATSLSCGSQVTAAARIGP